MRLFASLLGFTCLLSVCAQAAPFAELWQPKPVPAYVAGPAAPAAGGTVVNVQVNPDSVIRRVSPAIFGDNTAVWDGNSLLTDATAQSLQQGAFRVLRFPGGSTSDEYCWDGNYTSERAAYGSDASGYNQPWAVDTIEFVAVCHRVGAEPMITVNFGLSRYGSVAEATSLAARWVKYCNVDHDYRVKYWEVGNENYGDWEKGTIFPPTNGTRLTGAEYGTVFNQFVAAMKAVDPSIMIGAVSLPDDNLDSYTGYYGWMQQMLPIVQDTADFLSVHSYPAWLGDPGASITPAAAFANAALIGSSKSHLDTMILKYTHHQPGDIPYAMTEYNVENPQRHDMVELTNGLYTAIVMGEYARTGWAAANHWDVINGWDATYNADFGLLSKGQSGVTEGTQRAAYYPFALWSRFGDTLVYSTSSDTTVKAYAGAYSGGGESVFLVNTGTAARTVNLNPGSWPRKPQANLSVLDGDDFTSQQVRYNGVLGPSGGGPNNVASIPPYSLDAGTQGNITFSIPARSASVLVIRPAWMPGDVNGDGTIDLLDAAMAARFATGLGVAVTAQRWAADANGDGTITLSDAAAIAARAGGISAG